MLHIDDAQRPLKHRYCMLNLFNLTDSIDLSLVSLINQFSGPESICKF